jgi:iron complex transport system substrate-binding protein
VRRLALAVALLLQANSAWAARDVVSLNLCTDEALLTLAPERAAAVSFLARDPSLSVVAAAAGRVPVVRADAEAVLALHPALVLAGRYGAQAVLAALRAAGLRVVVFDEPSDFSGVRAEWAAMAALLGVKARGEAAMAAMDAALGAVPGPRGTAVWLEPRLVAAGADTIEGAVLREAGYVPVVRVGGLEALAAHPPGLLVVPGLPRFPSLADAVLAHPVLGGIARAVVPARLVVCAGPWSAEAVRMLR